MSGKSNAIVTLVGHAVVIIFNLGLDVSSKDYSKKTLTVTC